MKFFIGIIGLFSWLVAHDIECIAYDKMTIFRYMTDAQLNGLSEFVNFMIFPYYVFLNNIELIVPILFVSLILVLFVFLDMRATLTRMKIATYGYSFVLSIIGVLLVSYSFVEFSPYSDKIAFTQKKAKEFIYDDEVKSVQKANTQKNCFKELNNKNLLFDTNKITYLASLGNKIDGDDAMFLYREFDSGFHVNKSDEKAQEYLRLASNKNVIGAKRILHDNICINALYRLFVQNNKGEAQKFSTQNNCDMIYKILFLEENRT